MNDSRIPCESRLEEISLLAAGCLSDQEERSLREHLAECAACRERCDEMAVIGAGLRAAKPAMDAASIRAVERSLDQKPSPASDRFGARGWRVAALAAAALIVVGVLSRFVFRPADHGATRPPEVVRNLPHVTPENSPAAPADRRDSPLPTLLALRQAAAESDESLDRALARYAESLVSVPLNSQALWQESMQ